MAPVTRVITALQCSRACTKVKNLKAACESSKSYKKFPYLYELYMNQMEFAEISRVSPCCLRGVGGGRVAQLVGHLTRKSEVLGWILGLATYFGFSFH